MAGKTPLTVRVPGDKSVSQRALILAAMADGESRIGGLLRSADPVATGRALVSLGVPISALEGAPEEPVLIRGAGLRTWRRSSCPLDLANSGTGARLLAGALAAQPLSVVLSGDESLSRRPMERIAEPLRRMGAAVTWLGLPGVLPMQIDGGRLSAIVHESPVASAQVKSAVLLAAVGAGCAVEVVEPRRSRDHTERMLSAMGATVDEHPAADGWSVRIAAPPDRLFPLDMAVPGDFSSAAFFMAWAALHEDARLVLPSVGLAETRTGFATVLSRMGAQVRVSREASAGGEPVGDVQVESGDGLRAVEVDGAEVPSLIDEIPLVAVLAARAEGVTKITGAKELRVKESDRIAALAGNLRAVGVDADELADGLEIEGTRRPLSGRVRCFGDHRIAMAFGVLGTVPECDIRVDEPAVANVSFPDFWKLLADVERRRREATPSAGAAKPKRTGDGSKSSSRGSPRCIVVAVDGPAGSGKSTTAQDVAARLGFRHLDSGALYRGVVLGLLASGRDMTRLDTVSTAEVERLEIGAGWDGPTMHVVVRGERVPDQRLRSDEVTACVSQVSALPAVRACLLGLQRSAARDAGLVADGRDIATVVFPGADVKVFLVADARERARRRLVQGGTEHPSEAQIEAEAARLEARDAMDSSRKLAPLKPAQDAVRVDTTRLTPIQQADRIVRLVREARR